MRSAERELIEIERKRNIAEGTACLNPVIQPKNATDAVKDRVAELTKQIAEETKRLSTTRAQLTKLKNGTNSSSTVKVPVAESSAADANFKRTGVVPVPDGLCPELCR